MRRTDKPPEAFSDSKLVCENFTIIDSFLKELFTTGFFSEPYAEYLIKKDPIYFKQDPEERKRLIISAKP